MSVFKRMTVVFNITIRLVQIKVKKGNILMKKIVFKTKFFKQ